MSFKINPIAFRLGITRFWQPTNNISLTNYGFFWSHYSKYEKLLFLFFYKYSFWTISSKMLFLSPSLLLVFCNYYKLRTYFNKKPIRKKRRLKYDPDGHAKNYSWKKFLDKFFFQKKLKYTPNKFKRKSLKISYNVIKHNFYHYKYFRKVYKFIKSNFLRRIENRISLSDLKRSKRIIYKLSKFSSKFNLKEKYLLHFKKKFKNFNSKILDFKNSTNLKKKDALIVDECGRSNAAEWLFNPEFSLKKKRIINDESLFSNNINQTIANEKIFFFHLQRVLKCVFFKKNISLKLRNIQNLLPYKEFRWEDALRTSYLVQIKKKHFIRTIFRDFVFLQRIAYLEMDAQLFTKIIINLFQMTKFHNRLIYLIKSVTRILSRFYRHIKCKIRLKGKMQYKKRTKKTILFKCSLPLYQLNPTIEYGLGTAVTPFGALGIKVWLYYTSFQYNPFWTDYRAVETDYLQKSFSIAAKPLTAYFRKVKKHLVKRPIKASSIKKKILLVENRTKDLLQKWKKCKKLIIEKQKKIDLALYWNKKKKKNYKLLTKDKIKEIMYKYKLIKSKQIYSISPFNSERIKHFKRNRVLKLFRYLEHDENKTKKFPRPMKKNSLLKRKFLFKLRGTRYVFV